jgi:hypothetical protein
MGKFFNLAFVLVILNCPESAVWSIFFVKLGIEKFYFTKNIFMIKSILFLMLFVIILACNQKSSDNRQPDFSPPAAQKDMDEQTKFVQAIVDRAIARHGGSLYEHCIVKFTFRDRQYKATRRGASYQYERVWTDSTGQQLRDVLSNGGLYREINGKRVELSAADQAKYASSVNSVIYFALLPYFLNDKAVIKNYLGEVNVRAQPYHKIAVTFQQEGGGEDFEDEYVYWLHRDSLTMDYLAYNYREEGGGARFRSAYNVRYVNGIRFADYVNYAPQDTTNQEVATFDRLFETGGLQEFSKIETQNVEVIILK